MDELTSIDKLTCNLVNVLKYVILKYDELSDDY